MTLPRFETYKFTLAPLQEKTLALSGDFVGIVYSDVEMAMKIGDVEAKNVAPGFYYRAKNGERFTSLTFANLDAAASAEVRIVYGVGEFRADRQSPPGSLYVSSQPDVALPNNASTLIYGFQVNRRTAILSAPITNTGTVYIVDDAAVVAPEGIPLAPGEKVFLDTAAPLYVFNGTGAAQSVHRFRLLG